MPKTNSEISSSKPKKEKNPISLNSYIKSKISELAEIHKSEFAYFVIENYKKKEPEPLSLPKIKKEIYQYFSVKNTTELKKSGAFKMATDGMSSINIGAKDGREGWEKLYRKFIGILPGEENQQGYGCINGINVFDYFKPWQVFGLEPKTATSQDIKDAYRKLSKVYHPDVPETGDASIFDCLTTMYKSISASA
jgi:hypothetical protein